MLEKSKNDIKVLLKTDLEDITNKNFANEFGKLMVGNKVNLYKMLMIENDDKLEISFNGTDYDDKYDTYQKALEDKIEILDILKQIYDSVFLKRLFKGEQNASISSLMVRYYNQHKEDLNFIKELFRNNRKIYNKLFRNGKDACLYEKYITNKIDYDEFKKEINI